MAETPGGRVFISYRREDAGYPAGWLFDQLATRLGADRVFKDVDSIEPGDDFAEVITEAVTSCTMRPGSFAGAAWPALAELIVGGAHLDPDVVQADAFARGLGDGIGPASMSKSS